MIDGLVHRTRVTLIRMGKVAPFVICVVVLVSYLEDVLSLTSNNYMQFDDGVYLSKPVSWCIAQYFKYDIMTVFILSVISISIETCVFNKLACIYLLVNLIEKSFFDFEMEPSAIYCICIVNIIISGWLVQKGISRVMK